jgi:hypothetical protein
MKRVAIMQPTYLPWIGYFGLMQSVDLFIILDCVQFARRSWQQRNQIKTPNGPLWLSVPVFSKGKQDQLISEVQVDYSNDFPSNHLKSLEMNYKKTPYFDSYYSQLSSLLTSNTCYLSELTIEMVRWFKDVLGIVTPIQLASEYDGQGSKADLLASICKLAGATAYISPPGSKEYLDQSDAFIKQNIPVGYFEFTHPIYPQRFETFLPYMSTIDLLFNCGKDSLNFINQGCKDSSHLK